MIKAVSTLNAEHYLWGDECDGWHLLKRDDVSVIQERVPAGCAEVMHYHQVSRQFFFILEGQGSLVFKDQTIELQKGEGLEIPPGIPHQFSNLSQSDVRFLVISLPESHGDRMNV
jgi:mannose-6-phosphate isomerase-like protein (cupin superfamily)